MNLFKKQAPLEELIEKFNKLSDEEKEKFLAAASGSEEPAQESPAEDADAPETSAQIADDSEPPAEEAQENEDPASEEAEEDHKDPDDTPEDALPADEEPQTESEAKEPETPQVDMDALIARLDAMEEQFANLSQKLNSLLEATDDKPFGGISPELSQTDNDALSEDDRIMAAFMAKQPYRR